jgi:GDP/UDP-N,N'-diacetylbacillosamine 2-epimerase (hydrolysing)
MNEKIFNIGILTARDSDKNLSLSVFYELNRTGSKPKYIEIIQNDITKSYKITEEQLHNIDFLLAVGDRTEQIGGVLAAFQNRVPIGHLYAGDLNTIRSPATFDDIHRHTISLYSTIQFCSSEISVEVIKDLKKSVCVPASPHLVGATHFNSSHHQNNIEHQNKFDLLHSIYKPYILVLINSETLGSDEFLIDETVNEILYRLKENTVIFIAKGNSDNDKLESQLINTLKTNNCIDAHSANIFTLDRYDHGYFIVLMKNSEYFITNSSCAVYEAPFLLKKEQIVLVGDRNRYRTNILKTAHDGLASRRISYLIIQFLKENKRRFVCVK